MKKIGQGWQYTVWDIGENRVRKTFNTKYQAYSIFLRECFPYIHYPIWKFPKFHKDLRKKAVESISWVRQTNLELSLFANPKILNDCDYEQDRIVTLGEHLKHASQKDGEDTINAFVSLNKFLLQNSVIDKSFLIGKNYGLDAHGKVILIDIGELFFDKDKIERQIKLQPWDHTYVTSTIPKKFRNYFVSEMNKHFISNRPSPLEI